MSTPRQGALYYCRAPAKLNLFLEVVGPRADGYHDLEGVFAAVSLWDRLWFQPSVDGKLRVECVVDSRLRVGTAPPLDDEDNIAWRAVDRLRTRAGNHRLGGWLRIDKRIPWESGLGGGSSDAAAALLLANRGWRLAYDRQELSRIGSAVGSDVPFFFADGTALCRSRGEWVTPLTNGHRLSFVIAKPLAGLSTATVFSSLQMDSPRRSAEPMMEALRGVSPAAIGSRIWNRLTNTARALCPDVERVVAEIHRTRPLGVEMTGSGTACFGLYRNRRIAEAARRRLAASLADCDVLVCNALNGAASTGAGRIAVHERSKHGPL